MPTFVSLITYTDEGMKAIHDSPKRLALAKRYLKDLGGRLRQFYLTIGSYDAVIIYDLPDETAAAKLVRPTEIPWDDLAFQSTIDALKDYCQLKDVRV